MRKLAEPIIVFFSWSQRRVGFLFRVSNYGTKESTGSFSALMSIQRSMEDDPTWETTNVSQRLEQSLFHSYTASQPAQKSETEGECLATTLDLHPLQSQALQNLLRAPIHFQLATQSTFHDEEGMGPTFHSRVVMVDEKKPSNQDQINICDTVSRFLQLISFSA